jgi:DNA-binding MarR family transcriptional regulator
MPIQTRCACTRARRAARALTDLYDHTLAPVGLKVTQFSVLRTVQRIGQVSLSALGEEMALDRSTLGRNLRLLDAMGLVALSSGDDLRTQTAVLTRRGSERLRRALPLWERVQQMVRDRLGSDEVDAMFATLERVEALRPRGKPGSPVNEQP